MAQALATTGIALAALVFPLQQLIGWPGLIAALVTLLGLMGTSFVARREHLEWRGLLPISLLAYLVWATCSLVWSQYQWATVGGLAYLLAFTLVGLYIALSRDTIQIVRAFGDVLRVVLVGSLVLEVLSGIVINAPIPALGAKGGIALLQPIAALTSARDQLGLLAVVAAITFATELRTQSVRRGISILSLTVATACIVFTFSPIVAGATVVVAVAAALIYVVRRVPVERRRMLQLIILGLTIVALIAAWFLRGPIVRLFNASGVLNFRLELWQRIVAAMGTQGTALQGTGWIGQWQTQIAPFSTLDSASRPTNTALNAFVDVWFQLGIIGLVLFAGMVGLTFSRSWLLAGRRRSVVYAWPAAIMIALGVLSLAESSILTEFAWMCFVICCLKASQELSWRTALRRPTT
ncbi:hypothetical protein GCM10025881_10610 [Pseudolysinimonas kribbensis]|uniref:O-antigen ligase family protein n=2 Tax=Pseudolysinimonas kribbensis TaxID=433641 RepID=A0ABQ6K2S8_9MICO|nr:hypothetical protein GCM10025881_10610 [Pseudolysinimonas kribbensis]